MHLLLHIYAINIYEYSYICNNIYIYYILKYILFAYICKTQYINLHIYYIYDTLFIRGREYARKMNIIINTLVYHFIIIKLKYRIYYILCTITIYYIYILLIHPIHEKGGWVWRH